MNKIVKLLLFILFFIIVLFSSFFITYFVINYYHKQMVQNVTNTFIEDNFQDELKATNEISSLAINIDGYDIVGVIKIDKINYEGLVYEGTSLDILKKGVGHFKSSPLTNGNICLAAHNTSGFWKELHTLQNNDIITYTNVLGINNYKVFSIKQIEETDLNCLENTQTDILTLITCVKNVPSKRLCVQAAKI